jgi:predicted AAA+ superfamily ATPase
LTDWTALAETLDTDRRTAEAYAHAMALMFSIVILHKYELDRGGANLRAQKKLYFVDPLLAYIPHRIRRVGLEPELPALVENAVIMALFRSEERPLAEEFALPQALFYWRSKSGGEVDALGGSGPIAGRVPVEVKYRRTISARELAALTRSFERGIVVTAETLDLSDPLFPRVPAALFLWVLGGEHVAPVTSSEITHV